ncbi:DUF7693 family protein [Pseudomonas fluorescens]|uniref:DUF7693 family protein n=1 Tax=Pseudomonas fluorescens TaxID=294 RepID=UPI001240E256
MPGSLNESNTLFFSAQVLKDVAVGLRIMKRATSQPWMRSNHSLMPVDGLRLTLFNDYERLDYFEDCRSTCTQPAIEPFPTR